MQIKDYRGINPVFPVPNANNQQRNNQQNQQQNNQNPQSPQNNQQQNPQNNKNSTGRPFKETYLEQMNRNE